MPGPADDSADKTASSSQPTGVGALSTFAITYPNRGLGKFLYK